MKSRNTFKKGSCEMLVLHILSQKGDCYGYITDYKKQVGKRMIRVYYHIEPSGQDRLEELTQEYLKTTQSIQAILNFDFKNLQSGDTSL